MKRSRELDDWRRDLELIEMGMAPAHVYERAIEAIRSEVCTPGLISVQEAAQRDRRYGPREMTTLPSGAAGRAPRCPRVSVPAAGALPADPRGFTSEVLSDASTP